MTCVHTDEVRRPKMKFQCEVSDKILWMEMREREREREREMADWEEGESIDLDPHAKNRDGIWII